MTTGPRLLMLGTRCVMSHIKPARLLSQCHDQVCGPLVCFRVGTCVFIHLHLQASTCLWNSKVYIFRAETIFLTLHNFFCFLMSQLVDLLLFDFQNILTEIKVNGHV